MKIDELKRNFKVIDMMLTMHSILRDRNKRYAFCLDIALLFLSVVIVATVWLDPEIVNSLHISMKVTKIVLGICSIVFFFLSLLELRADWRVRAERHNQACETLGKLKAECREILDSGDPNPQCIRDQCQACSWALNSLVKIPDSKFNKLKTRHIKKIELGKLIETYPGIPAFLLSLILFFTSLKTFFRKRKDKGSE